MSESHIPVIFYSKKKNESRAGGLQETWYYLGIAGEIGFSIAIPIAVGAIGGSYLDKHFGAYPLWTLTLLVVGITLSLVNFARTIHVLMKKNI